MRIDKKKLSEFKNHFKEDVKAHSVEYAALAGVIVLAGATAYFSVKHPQHENGFYSFGTDSILKVEATEAEAKAFNRVVAKYLKVHGRREAKGARPPKFIMTRNGDLKIFDSVSDRLHDGLSHIDEAVTPVNFDSDFLVKN